MVKFSKDLGEKNTKTRTCKIGEIKTILHWEGLSNKVVKMAK